jgi:hypothetical protein
MRYLPTLLVSAAILAGCGGSSDNPAGPSSDSPVSVKAESQTLADLSTVVEVSSAVSDTPGWVTVHEDQGGTYGEILGWAHVDAGTSEDVKVALSRPATDGEVLHAVLHVDAGAAGVFESPGADTVAHDTLNAAVADSFAVAVPSGTPAVRIRATTLGMTAYTFPTVEPATFASVVGPENDNESLRFEAGWRYEIVNASSTAHPLEIVRKGATPLGDAVLLSQAVNGSLESDPSVAWFQGGSTMRFTASAALRAEANGYRCSIHISTMRGDLSFE